MAKFLVQHRRGTAKQWEEKNTIVPKEGEIVIEIDEANSLHKLKIGDGNTPYKGLKYLMAGDEIVTQVLTEVKPRVVTVKLTSNWTKVTDDKYSQVLEIEGITQYSKLDLQPNADMLAEFKQLGLVFVTENNGGTITVNSVGNVPSNPYTMQATIVETECGDEDTPVVGIPIGTPVPQADWSQTDKTKADYIKNKPDLTNAGRYSNNTPLIKDLGGILASNHANGFNNISINDLITELLYPYTKPVIDSFVLNPSVGAKEKNVSMTVNGATVKVTKKSKTIDSVSLYKGNKLVETKKDEILSSGTTLTFNINETLDGTADSVSYTVKVTEAGNNANTVTSSAQTYSFVYPYFYGVVESGTEITSDVITSFTKSIRTKGSHTYSYTTNNSCPVIAYPKSYGTLKSIIDPNNFTQNWTLKTVTVNNGSTISGVDYYVYVGGAATATATYKFNY